MNMLEAARKRLPDTAFVEADLTRWQPDEPADLLFANAVFQWLPDHLDIFDRLMDGLSEGGVLAVQMPDNLGEPSHLAMEETAHAGLWKSAFEAKTVRRKGLPPPSTYYSLLIAKSSRVDIWHTIYNHPMADAADIVEWVKGTGLMPYLAHARRRASRGIPGGLPQAGGKGLSKDVGWAGAAEVSEDFHGGGQSVTDLGRMSDAVKCLLPLAAYVAAKPARIIVGRKLQGDDTWTLPQPPRSPSSSSAPRET